MILTGEEAVRTLGDLTFSFSTSMVLSAAVKLNLADIIAAAGEDATLSAEEIAAKLPTDRASVTNLKRLLRVLVLHNIFRAEYGTSQIWTLSGPGSWDSVRYSLTPVSRLLVSGEGGSCAPVVRMQLHRNCLAAWHYLDQAVLNDGEEPFSLANEGKDIWTVGKEDEQFNKIVNEAMASASSPVLDAVLSEYKGFEDVPGVVADVGGGIGKSLQKIIEHNPHIKGINFDLPNVVATAPEIPGVKHVGGDMFKTVPEADAIYMKWVLHDWPDDKCIQILKNCWKSLPGKGGKVVLVENVVPPPDYEDVDELRSVATQDLLMLVHSNGGKERTASEWEVLSSAAGFSKVTVFPLHGANSVIELLK